MEFIDFNENHVEQAWQLVENAFKNEQKTNKNLPDFSQTCDVKDELRFFAREKLGFAAVENGELLGFLCSYPPFMHCYGSPDESGVWSPLHAHGFKTEENTKVLKLLYQAAGEKWRNAGAKYHSITFFSHQKALQAALSQYGFGCRCADSMMDVNNIPENLTVQLPENFSVCKIAMEQFIQLRRLRTALAEHLAAAPCFCLLNLQQLEARILKKETDPDLATFGLFCGDKIAGFIDVEAGGENFISCGAPVLNIQGMYLMEEFRGKKLAENLVKAALDFSIEKNCCYLGVDYETMNPTAQGFWQKYFEPYTLSMVRHLD